MMASPLPTNDESLVLKTAQAGGLSWYNDALQEPMKFSHDTFDH
jgi:hypothetical protein